jgi:ubiquinone/menaquinone biosynthesis C-methylase UbiE
MGESVLEMDATTVRERVSEAYGKLVSQQPGCCSKGSGGSACATGPQAIGYSEEDVRSVPEEASIPTFGCGNPLAFGEVKEGETVVDLGSGAGLDLLIAAEKVGPSGRVIGVDMTDEMIERARANVAAAGHTNVDVRKGLIEDLPVESGTVDSVISNCVINLSPEKDRVFGEIARVLKPGGRMLISDVVVEDLPQAVRESLAAVSACVGGAISEDEYVAGLQRAGLMDVEIRQRRAYTCGELKGFAESSGFAELTPAGSGCGGSDSRVLTQLAEELGGKVASVTVFARKQPVDA